MNSNKLLELEKRIERLEKAQGYTRSQKLEEVEKEEIDTGPGAIEKFFSWLVKDWLIKVGALLLVLALGWFARYSFLEGWIGPVGRITFGYLFSVGAFLLGNQQLQKRRVPAVFLLAIGLLGILITTFAAREMYDYFTPVIALVVMVSAIFTSVLIAHINNIPRLATLGLLGGSLVPVLAAATIPNYTFYICYAFVLTASFLIVSTLNSWSKLSAATSVVWMLMVASVIYDAPLSLVIGLVLAFFVAIICTYAYSAKNNAKPTILGVVTLNVIGLFTLFILADLVKPHMIGLALVGVALGTILLSDFLGKSLKASRESFYGVAVSALTIFFAATIFQFDGVVLNLVIGFEALALIFVLKNLLKKDAWAEYSALLLAVPAIWVFESFNALYYSQTIFNIYLVDVFGFVLILAAALAILKPTISSKPIAPVFVPALYAAFVSYFYGLIWVVNAVIFELPSTGKAVSLVIFTIFGLSAYFTAVNLKSNYLKYTGIFTMAFVVIRLLLVEVWGMTLVARVTTFLLIGLMMVGTSFYEKKYLTKK